MAKKSFMNKTAAVVRGTDSLLGNMIIEAEKNTSYTGTKEGEKRATFILSESILEQLRCIAYWDRTLIKDVVTEALQDYIRNYEEKNGEIKLIPKK